MSNHENTNNHDIEMSNPQSQRKFSPAESKLLRQWVLANVAGSIAGLLAIAIVGAFVLKDTSSLSNLTPILDPIFQGGGLDSVLPLISLGVIIGTAQWLVLRQRLKSVDWWIPLTVVSFGIGASTLIKPESGLRFWFVLGLLIGILQWFLLRQSYNRSGWWVLANVVGWFVSGLAILAVTIIIGVMTGLSSGDELNSTLLWINPILFIILVGAVTSVVTGIILVRLLRNPKQEKEKKTFSRQTSLLVLGALVLFAISYSLWLGTANFRSESVSVGYIHTCSISKVGDAYCWGTGRSGQLGYSPIGNYFEGPILLVPVHISNGRTFREVSSGGDHTCGVTTENTLFCWGGGEHGDLGNGSTDNQFAPVLVSGDLSFRTVSAGNSYTCGVTTQDIIYCWGSGGSGQLGNGSSNDQLVPVRVAGDLTFQAVSAGASHTCGITTQGVAYCWGAGGFGQLGNGTRDDQLEPVQVAGNLTFVEVSAGSLHTCGVTNQNAAYCWGEEEPGTLGNIPSGQQQQLEPVPVSGGLNFITVSAGFSHTCGITNQNALYCWGWNYYGQLGNGNGSRDIQGVPVLVSGGHSFVSVSAGNKHTCGITTDGIVYCWGNGEDGQLGNCSRGRKLKPAPVFDPNKWSFCR